VIQNLPEIEYFKTGDYFVTVRPVNVPVGPATMESRKAFVIVHRPSDVVAGAASQLPDAIRGCVGVDRETRIVAADPYGLAENTSSERAQ
jgi:hypothetical protein